MNVLHLVDCTCGLDTLDTVALIANGVPGRHTVLVLGHRDWAEAALLAGISRESLKWNRGISIWDPAIRRGIHKVIKSFEPTHIHAWGIWGLRALSSKIEFDGPHIIFLQTPLSQNMAKPVLDSFRQRPWLLVSPWQSTLDALLTSGIAPQRMVKINPGIRQINAAPTLPKDFRRYLGMEPKDGPVVLLGGWPEKNVHHEHGIWALAIVAKIRPQIWGIIRTDSTICSELNNSLTGYKYFRDTIEDPGLIAMAPGQLSWRQLLKICELVVFTPDQIVGMNGLLEAMAAGKPIISTATAQTREILQDGRNALLVPARNPKELAGCINTLVGDSQLRANLGREAKADFESQYRPEIFLGQIQSIYAQTSHDPQLRQSVVLSEKLNSFIGSAD
ncbi:MAG TPA: glycosyltransferase family 4 protein [Phycisphaerae bacterium]|nr:glycosyltransferase family 4 protein [Phycisphaerae bacterium]